MVVVVVKSYLYQEVILRLGGQTFLDEGGDKHFFTMGRGTDIFTHQGGKNIFTPLGGQTFLQEGG